MLAYLVNGRTSVHNLVHVSVSSRFTIQTYFFRKQEDNLFKPLSYFDILDLLGKPPITDESDDNYHCFNDDRKK